jgi:UDP-N-acetylglucosamine 2-epimerase (non-hydrolysing)
MIDARPASKERNALITITTFPSSTGIRGNTMRISIILGTRPEIIKMSPIIRGCMRRSIDWSVLHTGQHYSRSLDQVFFEDLELPNANRNLSVGSGSHGEETGKMLIGIEKALMEERPDLVMVQGDTNTVLAGALAASKLGIRIGHVEAGLRSFDRSMPEETNRVVADHVSDFLFAPTNAARNNLLSEGIPSSKIFVVGNTVVDAVNENSKIAMKRSSILGRLGLRKNNYILVTAHRQENVDVLQRLEGIIDGLRMTSEHFDIPVIFPAHPRTLKRIEGYRLSIPDGVHVMEGAGYLDFLMLLASSRLIMTDSGGVQEEACIMQVPCVTLRDNTERPETVEVGGNMLAGIDPERILECAMRMEQKERSWGNPFGDGKTAERILQISLGGYQG